MKRPLEEISQAPASGLSKTERRRLAKQAKRLREGKVAVSTRNGEGGKSKGFAGGAGGGGTAGANRKGKKGAKPKMTKEERRAKYTQKAYEAREKQNQAAPGANKTRCLGCRVWGHVVATCPEAKRDMGICFNCGSSKHALRACSKPKQRDGSLPHATCFVCKKKGHISAQCKQNANGIYPKGGFCKGCGSKHHLSRDCPDNPEKDRKTKSKDEPATAESEYSSEGENASASLAPAQPRGRGKSPEGGENVAPGKVGGTVGESKAKRRKEENSKASGRGARTAPVLSVGGDDLEDDGYYDPEDVPDVLVYPDGTEEFAEGGGGKVAAPKSAKKRAKVVMF